MQLTQPSTESVAEARRQAARIILDELRRQISFHQTETVRWKKRNANLILGTLLVVTGLSLIIAGETYWLLSIYLGGSK